MSFQTTAYIRGTKYRIRFNKKTININGILYPDTNPYERKEALRKSGLLYTEKFKIYDDKEFTIKVAGWRISEVILNETEIFENTYIKDKKIQKVLGINEDQHFTMGFLLDEDFYPYLQISGSTVAKRPGYSGIACHLRIYPSDMQRLRKIIKEIKEQTFWDYEYYPYSKHRKEMIR